MASDVDKIIGLEILQNVRRLQLPLKLDEITEGRGNCFPLAVLAQCRRPDIFRELNGSLKNIVYQNNPTILRHEIYKFMTNTKNTRIQEYQKKI